MYTGKWKSTVYTGKPLWESWQNSKYEKALPARQGGEVGVLKILKSTA